MRAISAAVSNAAGWLAESAALAIGVLIVGIIVAPVLIQFTGIPEQQALQRAAQLTEITRAEAAFCDKYGMTEGSGNHMACLNDLLDLRRQNEKRIAEQDQGIL